MGKKRTITDSKNNNQNRSTSTHTQKTKNKHKAAKYRDIRQFMISKKQAIHQQSANQQYKHQQHKNQQQVKIKQKCLDLTAQKKFYIQEMHENSRNYVNLISQQVSKESETQRPISSIASILRQKQTLMTDSSLRMSIAVDQLKYFGIYNTEPQNPDSFFKMIEKKQKQQCKKAKHNNSNDRQRPKIKRNRSNKLIKDNLVQVQLSKYPKKKQSSSDSDNDDYQHKEQHQQ